MQINPDAVTEFETRGAALAERLLNAGLTVDQVRVAADSLLRLEAGYPISCLTSFVETPAQLRVRASDPAHFENYGRVNCLTRAGQAGVEEMILARAQTVARTSVLI